jgi:hypothetical protein
MTIIGVLLAAGRGRRLGGNKQLTPWPTPDSSVTLIESSFDRLSVACDEIVVVLGHRQIEIQDTLRPRAHAALRADADADMSRSSSPRESEMSRVSCCSWLIIRRWLHPHWNHCCQKPVVGMLSSRRAIRAVMAIRSRSRPDVSGRFSTRTYLMGWASGFGKMILAEPSSKWTIPASFWMWILQKICSVPPDIELRVVEIAMSTILRE